MQVSVGGGVIPPSMQAWRSQLERNTFGSRASDGDGGVRLEETKARLKALQEKAAEDAAAAKSAETTGIEAGFARLDRNGDGSLGEAAVSAGLTAQPGLHGPGRPHRHAGGPQGDAAQGGEAHGGGLGSGLLAQLLGQQAEGAGTGAAGGSAGSAFPGLLGQGSDGELSPTELQAGAAGPTPLPPEGAEGLGNALVAQLFGQEGGGSDAAAGTAASSSATTRATAEATERAQDMLRRYLLQAFNGGAPGSLVA
ncbi:EF-hand domain-containing protein [Siccirubricoccus phaeus]|uniref:hypothetical protein n=1 Tax=Siccirubricoccus phaeus TaxID=2595053 RepID=UPI0011F273EC|nr:hypothetical protein [Siccirubricoccus phaeus]